MISKARIACMATCLALAACVSDNTDRTRSDVRDEPYGAANALESGDVEKEEPKTEESPEKPPESASLPAAIPAPAANTPQAPDEFSVKFITTVGEFTIDATRESSPHGVDRFHELVTNGFFDDVAFFRVIEGFMIQFGIHGDAKVGAKWRTARVADDPSKESNTRGTIGLATGGGPNTRTTQVFINIGDNPSIDTMGFIPFGRVVKGMDVVDKIHKTGEGAPIGPGPSPLRIHGEGNVYLKKDFPRLDYIKTATIVK